MKKSLAFLMILLLTVSFTSVQADALPDLQNSGLPDLDPGMPAILAPIPDPAESLGSTGAVYQMGYAYNGAEYDLYLYAKPEPADAFIAAYTKAAEDAGYQVEKGNEAGQDALYISGGEMKAILLYDYQDHMLLFVPQGADFALASSVQPTPEPVVKENYLSLDLNGYHYESGGATDADYDSILKSFVIGFTKFGVSFPYANITLFIPNSLRAGESITVTKKNGEGSSFAAGPNNLTVYFEDDRIVDEGQFYGLNYDYCDNQDYLTVTITKAENTPEGYLIEGTLECNICSKKESRHVEIRNGVFSFYYYE